MKRCQIFIVLVGLFFLTGCAAREISKDEQMNQAIQAQAAEAYEEHLAMVGAPAPEPAPKLVSEPNYAIVRTYFATDRNLTEDKDPDEMFGGVRSTLRYGTCDVSIPRNHKPGQIESTSIWRFELREDPAKHVIMLKPLIIQKDKFFDELAVRVQKSSQKKAFIFVHGYNVSFDEAAKRTAQMSYDLKFDGVPVFFSWPSSGLFTFYSVDANNSEWARTDLKNFLADFFVKSDADQIYLIAHSMGNRALPQVAALLIKEKPEFRKRLKEVILAAPDIDADTFKREIAPALLATGCPITLYASSQDKALAASELLYHYPRAGDSGDGLILIPGIETIDASRVDTSFLGHSYIAESESVLLDMTELIGNGKRADERPTLMHIDNKAVRYWKVAIPMEDNTRSH